MSSPTETPSPAGAHKHKRRVPLWDNARWIAITLMVIGHAILKLIGESDAAYGVYLFIYAFHVPVFVAVSGYFAKSGPPGPRQMHRLITDVVFPYLIFETIWTLVSWALSGTLQLDYSSPSWTLWFLIALTIWRVVLPYLVLMRYPLLISIAVSVGAGYVGDIDSTFSLSRTLGLLPFFVFGWKLRQWPLTARWTHLSPTAVWRWRAGAIALFGALAVAITLNIVGVRDLRLRSFTLYDEAYWQFGYDQFWAGVIRLALMMASFAFILAFLILMPRRATWFTPLGAATMYIYLLHTFLLYPLRETGVLDGPQPAWVLPAVILLAVGISVLLSLPQVKRIFRPLVEPRLHWLFRQEPSTHTGTIVLPHGPRKP